MSFTKCYVPDQVATCTFSIDEEACRLSLMQVATATEVFLFDLIALQSEPALGECLQHSWQDPGVMILGFELSGDLSKLATSCAAMEAFRRATNVLDIKSLWLEWAQLSPPPVRCDLMRSLI